MTKAVIDVNWTCGAYLEGQTPDRCPNSNAPGEILCADCLARIALLVKARLYPKLYDCHVCRGFAGNGLQPGPDGYMVSPSPTDAEPWHPDCYAHQHRWNKPRCKHDLGEVRPGVDPEVRCELEAGQEGDCRFVFMEND